MPSRKRETPEGKVLETFRTQRHVDAQRAQDEVRAAVAAFGDKIKPLVSKAARVAVEDATKQAMIALSHLIEARIWDALDVGEPVGEPYDVKVLKRRKPPTEDDIPEEEED